MRSVLTVRRTAFSRACRSAGNALNPGPRWSEEIYGSGQQALLPIGGHHTNAVERGPVNQLRADDRINQHILFLIHRSVDLKRLEEQ